MAVPAGPIFMKRKKMAKKYITHARGHGTKSMASMQGNATSIPLAQSEQKRP